MSIILNDSENEAAHRFMMAHYARPCKRNQNAKIELIAEANGIGLSLTVRCPYCRETQGISDISCW